MNPHLVNKKQVAVSFSRAAEVYARRANLQKQVAERLVEKLDFIKHEPAVILDVGAGTGFLRKPLQSRYKSAQLILSDLAQGMLVQAKKSDRRFFSKCRYTVSDMENLPFQANSVDLLISSLAIQWCNDLDKTMAEFFRVLRPGGLLMFSTLGPDTLKELRESWAMVDESAHINTFLDMHDVGDCMLRTGFAGPVMDVDHYTLTYNDPIEVMKDLKSLGSGNHLQERRRDMIGKTGLRTMLRHYESLRQDSLIPSTYEVVFGHAWCPENKQIKTPEGEIKIPMASISRVKNNAG